MKASALNVDISPATREEFRRTYLAMGLSERVVWEADRLLLTALEKCEEDEATGMVQWCAALMWLEDRIEEARGREAVRAS